MARPEKFRLGELLVAEKLVSPEQLGQALAQQKRTGRKLGRVLVDGGLLTEEQIAQALAKQLNIPYINLKYYSPAPEVVHKLPESQARRYRALVLEDRKSSYLVGMADPSDLFAFDEISRLLKREIELAVVVEGMLLQTIDRIYRRTDEISGLVKELEQDLGEGVIDFGAFAAAAAEEAPVVKLLQTIFEDAIRINASDIHIEPQERRLQIRFRIDGLLHHQADADIKIAPAVAQRLKLISGLDISEKRLPQDGRFNIKVRDERVDVRISCMPTQYGESVAMRLLSQTTGLLGLEKIGMPADTLDKLRKVAHRPSGMILVTGPTGSGKTTTLYALLQELNTVNRKIITVEDPVEYRLPGLNQVQVNEKIDLTFSKVLRSALRQDPDIVLLGEIRDNETAQIGLRAAITGHMVLSTLHTRDAVRTPIRLFDMGVPRYMVAMSLNLVLAQRLVRKVCESCAEAYDPTPQEREWLGHELGARVGEYRYLRGRGCAHCNGTGYLGRTGVFELLDMARGVVEAVSHEDPVIFVDMARKQIGHNTLRHNAVQLVAEGKTTVSEAMLISGRMD